MIGIVDVEVQAANPSMPLYPMRAYVSSPSSVRVRNVPKKIGNWQITKVFFNAQYPDDSIEAADCVLVGGVWVGTIAGSTTSGYVENGYTVFADGIDENGNEVHGYVLGKGDVTILEADGTITPGVKSNYVHLLSAQSSLPKDGDLWQTEGSWYIYQDGTSYPIGDDSGLIRQLSAELSSKADVSSLTAYALSSDLSSKQDKLTDAQISAIDSVVDECATVITFSDNTISSFNWVGEVNQQTLIDAGIYELNEYDEIVWIKYPTTVKFGTTVTCIGTYVFDICNVLSSVTIPDSVTNIGGWAFSDCTRLAHVIISDSITSIGDYAFANCQSLSSVTIPDGVTSIGENTFQNCFSLMSVTIPDSVTSIGPYAFYGCEGLTSVTIIDNSLHNLKTIGDCAFQGCSSLLKITVPQGITSIGVDAFADNYAYFKLYLEEAIPTLVPSTANYPWGVANTANIITVRNASKEWVEEQAYGKGFVWRNATVNARTHTCSIYAFNINAMTLSTAAASFKVALNATSYNTARDLYFVLTLGNFTQPMTWDTPFDVFEGGSAAAIAPKPNKTNIYHIFEYASGHFMVSLEGAALDELGDIETLINAI